MLNNEQNQLMEISLKNLVDDFKNLLLVHTTLFKLRQKN